MRKLLLLFVALATSLSVMAAECVIALKGKYTEDATDAKMVDLIMGGAYLDPAYMLISATNGIAYTLRECIFFQNSDFASMYQNKSIGIEDNLESYIEYYED